MLNLADYKFIDIHYHASPDLYKRSFNSIEAGKIYQSFNGAVVLKSHLGSTGIQATLAQELGLPVLPSLVLNSIAGGINYRVILRALVEYQPAMAAKMIVHFPTITGRKYTSKLARELSNPYLHEQTRRSETLFNDDFQLRKEVIDIVKMANDHPIVLSTGHASKEETYQLIDVCAKYNVQALLLNQPANPLTDLKAQELNEIAKNEFVWIEQTLLTYLLGHQDKADFSTVLTTLPRVIYSSDLGQTSQMDIAEWVNYSETMFAELGISTIRKDELCRKNALTLLM
ncbi:MAG: DUF6282 family protein [Legionella sp.]|nr:DUF6282 family protein [Legionella sp.]